MGAGHSHGAESKDRLVAPYKIRKILFGVTLIAGLLAIGTMISLWPRAEPPKNEAAGAYAGVTFISGKVEDLTEFSCGTTPNFENPPPKVPAESLCVSARAALTDGRKVLFTVPPPVKKAGLSAGDKVRLIQFKAEDGNMMHSWSDYDRRIPLGLLAGLFVISVLVIARLKGLAAILGLGVAYFLITKFMLPALILGENPILVGISGSTVIMILLLYLAHGVNTKTTVALLGTISGLLLTASLAWVTAKFAHLDGLSSEENFQLSQLTTGAGIGAVILCGVIIAGLGVLNDVTIAQAASVWELKSLAPQSTSWQLFHSGMRIGRDHLASTVYTIIFAYAGTALPTMLLINLYRQPLVEVVNSGQLAEEIVRALVSAIGLVLTIPLTTAIAAVVASKLRVARSRSAKAPSAASESQSVLST